MSMRMTTTTTATTIKHLLDLRIGNSSGAFCPAPGSQFLSGCSPSRPSHGPQLFESFGPGSARSATCPASSAIYPSRCGPAGGSLRIAPLCPGPFGIMRFPSAPPVCPGPFGSVSRWLGFREIMNDLIWSWQVRLRSYQY